MPLKPSKGITLGFFQPFKSPIFVIHVGLHPSRMRRRADTLAETPLLLSGEIRDFFLRFEQIIPVDGEATQQGTRWSRNREY